MFYIFNVSSILPNFKKINSIFKPMLMLSAVFICMASIIFFRYIFHYYLQFLYNFQLVEIVIFFFEVSNNLIVLSINRVSILFLVLTTIVFPIIILNEVGSYYYNNTKVYKICIRSTILIILEVLSIFIFLVQDLFSFLVLYEIMLIPLMFFIGIFGSRQKKNLANMYLLIYSILGSSLLLIIISVTFKNTNQLFLYYQDFIFLDYEVQVILYFLITIAFLTKIPVFPFYYWLVEAHVESPTGCSAVLAALF